MNESAPVFPKQLLLVEDDSGTAIAMQRLLRAEFGSQLETTWVTNLADARKAFASQNFAAVITDNNFPSTQDPNTIQANGIELIKQVRSGEWNAGRSAVPIFFQTTGLDETLIMIAEEHGVTQCGNKRGTEQWRDFVKAHMLGNTANIAVPEGGYSR